MHNHELINRGYLKAKVWNNYGNADEALNQAISYLRKVLADDAKTMIETVPKKGYILRTVIKFDLDKKKTATATGAGKQKLYWAAAAILLVLIVAGYFILRPKASAPGASSPDVIQRGLKDTTKGKDTSADEKKAANPDVLPK
jgi:DNA-binding winged helix-turn-helix (wHTH) protein